MATPKKSATLSAVERRAEELDTIAAVLPMERRDELAELLTDEDVETLRHLVNQGMGDNTLRALTSDLAYLGSRKEQFKILRQDRTEREPSSRRRMIVCREVANFLAMAETLIPTSRSWRTSCFCFSLRIDGRPRVLPSAFARLRPDCVLSISKSRSN
ncbi:hypothetical protein QE369_001962 [Agrobacterium larrymoorei]|uniref:Uncharacterized protein n=1 Tax=Agrobacterium larrymoorei TaxID=160699 RepID=A0AAJ2BLG9_9HYPH|nr:hypothetical protein [Agrobacterium larrymoorei]